MNCYWFKIVSLQLFQVASEAVDQTGKPVLVILRKFSEKLIAPQHLGDSTNSDVFDLHRSQGIHFYFTYNWWVG